jgi:hypothetical protein
MSERDSNRRRKIGGSNSGGCPKTAVLVAAVSLLATSLGVSAATLPDTPAEKYPGLRPSFSKLAQQGSQTTSNQLKVQSNQLKMRSGTERALNFTKPGQKVFPTETIKQKYKSKTGGKGRERACATGQKCK